MHDLDLLETFVAVVDMRGFTRAGERVHRTQSTVSQQIRRLEETLGQRLLERDRAAGAVVPTEEGELLLAYARRLLALSAEARQVVGSAGAMATVRLGVPEDFAGRRLTDLLSGFAREHPRIRLDTESGWGAGLQRQLAGGDLDLALVKQAAGEGRALARWPERLSWVAAPAADMLQDPLPLALFPAECIYRQRAIETLQEMGRRWWVAYCSQGLMGVQAAVSSGLGVSLLSTDALLPDHRRLGAGDGFPEVDDTELALVARPGRLERPVRQLVDFLLANLVPAAG